MTEPKSVEVPADLEGKPGRWEHPLERFLVFGAEAFHDPAQSFLAEVLFDEREPRPENRTLDLLRAHSFMLLGNDRTARVEGSRCRPNPVSSADAGESEYRSG